MPKLQWIGRDKVINHDLDVPYRPLVHKYGFDAKEPEKESYTGSGNIIIHGDNLDAVKSLLPFYKGRIKCIYIDPPYNTGEEKWVYNDNVNDPRIKKWIGNVVGPENEDMSRDDKWLCMMYPRLKVLRMLLKEDGAIFISIDDNELAELKMICNEIFGKRNFVGQWMWYKSSTPPNLSKKIKKNLEYILCYEKKKNNKRYVGYKKTSESNDPITKPQNRKKVLEFRANSLICKTKEATIPAGTYGTKKYPNVLLEDLIIKNNTNVNAARFENRFTWEQKKLEEELSNKTKIYLSKDLVISYKKNEYSPEVPPNLIDGSVDVGTTEEAGKILKDMFDGEEVFQYPKDVNLIKYLINFMCDKGDIILDSFAGSGTTAEAVLDLNKGDGGKRRFILIEMLEYADRLTASRVKKAMTGYTYKKTKKEGTGGAFDFYELGKPMFDQFGYLNDDVSEKDLREYIYFCETKQRLTRKQESASRYFLDKFNGTAYYLFYNKAESISLSLDTLCNIKEKAEQYIIYASTCTLDESMLSKKNIIFKQIPNDIEKF